MRPPQDLSDAAASAYADTVPSSDETMAAYETLQEYLKPLCPRGQLHDVKPAIQRAILYHDQVETARKDLEATHAVIKRLKSLQNSADHGEYHAKNIRADLAAAWSKGEHRPQGPPPASGQPVSTAEVNAAETALKGVTIEGAIGDFANCLRIIEALDGDLANSIDATTAAMVYDAYDDVSDSYSLMRICYPLL